MAIPSYVFATPVLGGQAALALAGADRPQQCLRGRDAECRDGPLRIQRVRRPRAIPSPASATPIPQFSLRWNAGVHNFMTYVTGNIPVGAYDSRRLANLGIGHGAVDAGGGYTYFNPQTGQEFSAVLGFTYNFDNQSTQYQNGVDMHLDWATSKFITKQWQIGLVGYVFNQLSCDSGAGDRVGCFESRVMGVGPQIGYIFPLGTLQGYINLKGYKEFDAAHRPDDWNVWLTFSISPRAKRGAAAGHDQEVAGALEPRSRSLTARWSKGGAPRSTTEWLTTVKLPAAPLHQAYRTVPVPA